MLSKEELPGTGPLHVIVIRYTIEPSTCPNRAVSRMPTKWL